MQTLEFKNNQEITHKIFGKGVITNIEKRFNSYGQSDSPIITVYFYDDNSTRLFTDYSLAKFII